MFAKVYVQSAASVLAAALGWAALTATLAGGAPAVQVPPSSLQTPPAQTSLSAESGAGEGIANVVADRLADARAKLEALLAEGVGSTNAPQGLSSQNQSLRRALYQRLVALYEQQLRATSELAALKGRRAEIARERTAGTVLASRGPTRYCWQTACGKNCRRSG